MKRVTLTHLLHHTREMSHTRKHTHTRTNIYTIAHTHATRARIHTTLTGPAWAQMLVEAGSKDLLMLTDNNGRSCLFVAAQKGHDGMGKVRQGMCRQIGNEACDSQSLFFDGYCSTVQGLLDWFEVDLGFTRAFIYSNRLVCSVCFCSPLVLF